MANTVPFLGFDWDAEITDADREQIIGTVMRLVDRWKLRLPAYLLFSGVAPFGNIASNGLIVASPFAAAFFPGGLDSLQKVVRFLSRPRDIRALVDRLAEEPDGTR